MDFNILSQLDFMDVKGVNKGKDIGQFEVTVAFYLSFSRLRT